MFPSPIAYGSLGEHDGIVFKKKKASDKAWQKSKVLANEVYQWQTLMTDSLCHTGSGHLKHPTTVPIKNSCP